MTLRNPVEAKKQYYTVIGELPEIENALLFAHDPIVRNRYIVKLAKLDQSLAELRDALIASGCTLD